VTPKFSSDAQKDTGVQVLEPDETVTELGISGDPMETAAAFKGSNPEHFTRFGSINIAEAVVDPRIQRPRQEALISKIGKNFKVWAMGVVVISVRNTPKGERFVVLDGQQRMAGAQLAGYEGPVQALFHFGLTFQEEAQLFRLLNTKKSVPARDMFKNLVNEGDPLAVSIQAVLAGLDVRTARAANDSFDATDMALRIAKQRGGLAAFQWAMEVAKGSFNVDLSRVYDGRVIEGLAMWRLRHGDRLDTQVVIRKLRADAADSNSLIGEAKIQSNINGGRIPDGVAAALTRIYMKNKRSAGPNAILGWYEGRKRRVTKVVPEEPETTELVTA
jgi:hypothetical protein